jgi:hypothetical protein
VCAVTVELSLFELAAPILREHDEFTGLSLWSLGS